MNGSHSTDRPQAIPARLVIGVTGHRKLDNTTVLAAAVRTAIVKAEEMAPPLKHTPLLLSVLSPLAEGADRLVAREVLKVPGARLEAVLPLEQQDYLQDFQTEGSRTEFEDLLSRAGIVRTLPPTSSRDEAYEQVGFYVVDQCDLLIALWDGKPSAGRGGTQEIVQHARAVRCPLIWIDTENPSQVEFEAGRGIDSRPFADLDKYNSERFRSSNHDDRLSRETAFIVDRAEKAGLPADRTQSTVKYILTHYIRGDVLALSYQHLYYRAETLVYALALLAVVIAVFQILFVPERPVILVSEIALMAVVLTVVLLGRRRRWHEKWIDYRFLAERFRSALFLALVDIDVAMLRPPRHLSLAYSPKDWMILAFTSVWQRRPRLPVSDPLQLERFKQFICEAWIKDQISYHANTAGRHYRRHRRLANASYTLFGLTIIVAILHIAGFGPGLLETGFAFAAIILPAVAASLTAIRTHRDYLRNAMRSGEMARHLDELRNKMARVQDYRGFLSLVKETEETMLHENEDWRVVVRFHTIEPV